jgi:tRNA dimethylallyltransferase
LKVLICIGGPTASGKTAMAIKLAKELNTEILSFDSRQIYHELNIGVAKPDSNELSEVKHHMIGNVSVERHFNAGTYEREAGKVLDSLLESNNSVVAVGGTGFYLNALIDGLDDMPEVSAIVNASVEEDYRLHGLDWLRQYVIDHDPEYASEADLLNPVRLLRAAKIIRSSGKAFSYYRRGLKRENYFKVLKYFLEPDREKLYHRINLRVDDMMTAGLLNEAKSLQHLRYLKALNTVGYTELMDYLDGKTSLEEAIELIKRNTRRYAKRQFTWFRNQGDWISLNPESLEENIKIIKQQLYDLENGSNDRRSECDE